MQPLLTEKERDQRHISPPMQPLPRERGGDREKERSKAYQFSDETAHRVLMSL
jgi:hypothetical protein